MTDSEAANPSTSTQRSRRLIAALRPMLLGLAIAALGTATASILAAQGDAVSAIAVAVALGILVRTLGVLPDRADVGLTFAAKKVLRIGIVLLGFRLAFGDLVDIGWLTLLVVLTVVVCTLAFTYGVGRLLNLPPALAVLTGTGFAICGATAVAAMREVIDADDDAPAFAIALVTIFGTTAIIVLPLLGVAADLSAVAFGQWAGSAVHDVGQVVATAAIHSDAALGVAVVVKLARVLLLGPLLVAVGLWWRRQHGKGDSSNRPGLLPPFILLFLIAVGIRSAGILPGAVIDGIRLLEGLLLTAALFALGTGVKLSRLKMVGARALLLGVIAFVAVAGMALIGVLLVVAGG